MGSGFGLEEIGPGSRPAQLFKSDAKTNSAPGPRRFPVSGGAPRPGAAQSPYMLLRARISATLPLFMRETPLTFEYPR